MILHYLKVAFRNLLKYKTHSLISAICLSVGFVCYGMINTIIPRQNDLSNYEQRIGWNINRSDANQSQAYDPSFCHDDIKRLEEMPIKGYETLTAYSYKQDGEVNFIDSDQKVLPFIMNYAATNPNFYRFYDLEMVYGDKTPVHANEVVVSEKFARKISGKENPVGATIELLRSGKKGTEILSFKIVNVLKDHKNQLPVNVDCYFLTDRFPDIALRLESFLSANTDIKSLNKTLESRKWEKRDEGVIYTQVSSLASKNNHLMVTILVVFLSLLILVSGLINFLKFIIQMFYNRQRELALRKCIGSDMRGIFMLLFAEVFWMLLISFLFSLALTEVAINIIQIYIPSTDFNLVEIYLTEGSIFLILLIICLLIIGIAIRRLRRVSIIDTIVRTNGRHLFRNVMMWLQLCISIFFVGSSFALNLVFNETLGEQYSPISEEEEEHIVQMSVNSLRMYDNMSAILSEIEALPEVVDKISSASEFNNASFDLTTYKRANQSETWLTVAQGDPHYFEFFKIPMQGKDVGSDAQGTVYISEALQQQLNEDGVKGNVTLEDQTYRIAGTYKTLYKEDAKGSHTLGSVFFPSKESKTFYFRISPESDTKNAIRRITEICRHYVPETLPIDIRYLNDNKQTNENSMILNAMLALALISLILVILSIYSAISMDTISRQKEVAIRKINGATPKAIALIFGKAYLYIFVLAFVLMLPLLRISLIKITQGQVKCVYNWDWSIYLFFSMALLVFATTAYKIYKIMHINPAKIIKSE